VIAFIIDHRSHIHWWKKIISFIICSVIKYYHYLNNLISWANLDENEKINATN